MEAFALGIVDKYGGTMNGREALKALDAKFITELYKERATVKTKILETEFGRDDPHDKLQILETLMETRNTQTGAYDDAEFEWEEEDDDDAPKPKPRPRKRARPAALALAPRPSSAPLRARMG